jgi:hypothetical protein
MSLCFYVFGNAPLRAPAWGHAEKGPKICLQKGPIILYEIIIETQQLNWYLKHPFYLIKYDLLNLVTLQKMH